MILHPADETLSLYAGSDLGLWTRMRIGRHVRRCERCAQHVEEFRGLREILSAGQDEAPPHLNWNELAAEMKANIHLGVVAGQCVSEPRRQHVGIRWRMAAVALPLLLMVLVAWLLQTVPPPLKLISASGSADGARGIVLESGASGIGVEQDGRGFRLLQPQAAQNVMYSVGGDSVRSRYVDSDTGQVTISHVYYAE
jgi:hypothetical protein